MKLHTASVYATASGSKRPRKYRRLLVLCVWGVVVSFFGLRADAFTISTATRIHATKVYGFYFSATAVLADYTVKVSPDLLVADLSLKIVHEPEEADLIFLENDEKAQMFVAKMKSPVGVKTINVSSNAVTADITVKLSEDILMPDYKIYVLSSRFSKEEAAALFAVTWKEKRAGK